MALEPVRVEREYHEGGPSKGEFLLGDALELLEPLAARYRGQIKLVYLDPPFLTGERFSMRVRVGEAGWRATAGSLRLETFCDHSGLEPFLGMMRRVLTAARDMLR